METESFLQEIIAVQNTHITRLAELMVRSEARIDRTNEMIMRLSETTDKSHAILQQVTNEYSKHLDSLSECRNALIEQNKSLLKMHEHDATDKRELRKEIKDMRDKMFDVICRISGAHGVKVENKFSDD